MATVNEYVSQAKELLNKFSLAQKISLAALAVALIVGFSILMSITSQPKFEVLFSGLTAKDAGKIVDDLKTTKIPYKVESGGSTILVPQDQVYEQRMKFANMGIPQEGVIGYEIFDQTHLGMTDFVQKLNYHRALEGELSRTLVALEEIQQARVHIVVPKPALFEEDKKPTTASVVLRMRGSAQLSRDQIQGVANLVASSVEGLKPENIAILDSRGNVLSADMGKDQGIALSASQYELRRQVEKYYEDKAQSLLIGALGAGKSIVRVTADLDFNKIEKTKQSFDPEGQVVRSEETANKTSTSGSQTPDNATTNSRSDEESNVTNYEITNTVEHVVNAVGNIQRISVAVIVDGNYNISKDEEGKTIREYVERPPEELSKLNTIVRNTLGIDPARGDQLSVSSMPFDYSEQALMEEEFDKNAKYEFWKAIIEKAVLALIVLAILLTIRWMFKRARNLARQLGLPEPVTLAPAGAHGIPGMVIPGMPPGLAAGESAEIMRKKAAEEVAKMEEAASMETLKKAEMQKKLVEYIAEKPDEATQLVRTWLYGGEQ